MDGATAQLNLQIRVDGLRDDLIFVCGNLKKNGYDYTMTLEPLLRDTEPVSHELVQRLTVRLQSLQKKMSLVKLTHERPSDEISLKSPAVPVPVKNPTPIAAKTETKARKRQRLNYGSDGEVLPRRGLFVAFLDCRQKTIQEIEPKWGAAQEWPPGRAHCDPRSVPRARAVQAAVGDFYGWMRGNTAAIV
jgi:hypothetical protein